MHASPSYGKTTASTWCISPAAAIRWKIAVPCSICRIVPLKRVWRANFYISMILVWAKRGSLPIRRIRSSVICLSSIPGNTCCARCFPPSWKTRAYAGWNRPGKALFLIKRCCRCSGRCSRTILTCCPPGSLKMTIRPWRNTSLNRFSRVRAPTSALSKTGRRWRK